MALMERILEIAGRRCQGCGRPVGARSWLCPECLEQMPQRRGGYCPCCGALTADPLGPVLLCAECRQAAPPWASVAFWGAYRGRLRRLMTQLKFAGQLGVAGLGGWMLAEAVHQRHIVAEAIVPVPMWPAAVAARGFNQSVELARQLSRHMGWPLHLGLRKVRQTLRQARLNRRERQENVAGAFAAQEVKGLRLMLVDDIMTTGATLRACALACRTAGAQEIHCAVVARA
jgi:ComF family protein